jgi:hypothetical protein
LILKKNQGESDIFNTIKNNDITSLRMLYNSGSSIQEINNDGDNLIMFFIKNLGFIQINMTRQDVINNNNPEQILVFLLEHGLIGNNTDNKNKTPYQLLEKLIKREKKNIGYIDTKIPEGNSVKHNLSYKKMSDFLLTLMSILSSLQKHIYLQNSEKNNVYNKCGLDSSPIELNNKVCLKLDDKTKKTFEYNLSEEECIQEGGQQVVYPESSIKCSVGYYKSSENNIDKINQDDLYNTKNPSKMKPKIPKKIRELNNSIKIPPKVIDNNYNYLYEEFTNNNNNNNIIRNSNLVCRNERKQIEPLWILLLITVIVILSISMNK